MKYLLLMFLISGCASTQKNFCQKVNKAELDMDYEAMSKAMFNHLKENNIPREQKARQDFLFSELRKCGYDVGE